jgi:hypothetical protein
LGSYKLWVLGASNAASCNDAVPVIFNLDLFAGLAPGFEPLLIAAQNVGIGFVDSLLQLGYGSHLVGKAAVKPHEIQQPDSVGVSHGTIG